ncbi:MAG: methyltransferase domain-containing protein [Armatimonadetes bacterium]|nr:methyltransferase domain-containing protein [Armatimonadota bacterium]
MAVSSDWNASLYDARLNFVTSYGESVLELLEVKPGEEVIDLGCGTGRLTAEIADAGASVIGIDASPAMLETARSNYPQLRFMQADASNFKVEHPVDAVFSNAALHWVLDAEGAVRSISNALKPGGRLVAEFGGKGNIRSIESAFLRNLIGCGCHDAAHAWYFPSIGEYASLLEKHGLEPATMWLFDRPTPMEGEDGLKAWLTQFGHAFTGCFTPEQFDESLNKTVEDLKPTMYREGVWTLDYRRLRVIARKL